MITSILTGAPGPVECLICFKKNTHHIPKCMGSIFACAFEPESRVEVKKQAEERSPPQVDKPMRKRKREETVQPIEDKFSGPKSGLKGNNCC